MIKRKVKILSHRPGFEIQYTTKPKNRWWKENRFIMKLIPLNTPLISPLKSVL